MAVSYSSSRIVPVFAIEVNTTSTTSTISEISTVIRTVIGSVSYKIGAIARVRVVIGASVKGYYKPGDFGIAGIAFTGFGIACRKLYILALISG